MAENEGMRQIPLENITISKKNARTIDTYIGLDELAQSIKEIGLQQPVVVFPILGQENRFELIIGQRRFLACKNLGMKAISAIVLKKPMNNVDSLAYSFSENIHRRELDYRDKIEVALSLIKELGTVRAVSKKLGVSESTVRNYLGYSAIPGPIKEMVEKGQLSKFTAVRIAKTNPDPKRAVAIAAKVKEEPRREKRNEIIQTAIENPTYTAEKVFAEAPKTKFKHVTLDLTNGAAVALKRASEKFELEPREIATQVLIDYLKTEGFYESS